MATSYMATVEGDERELEVAELALDSYRLKFAGHEHDVDVRRIGPNSFSILVDQRSFDFDVVREGEELLVFSRAGTTRVTLVDAARRHQRRPGSQASSMSGRVAVKAMMPGRIVNLLVRPGDNVSHHQGVIVVEAMKMENELKAPKAGKVVEVKVSPGQTVERGEALVIIE